MRAISTSPGLACGRNSPVFSQIGIWLIQWELRTFREFPATAVLSALLASTLSVFRSRAALQLEIIALRHQVGVLQRSVKRPKLNRFDRFLWAWFCGVWPDWRSASAHRQTGNRHHVAPQGIPSILDLEDPLQSGRPPVSKEIRKLIRKMSRDNPPWGAPRIHGELLKLGIDIG
jgi:hypothetical protein